MLVMTLLSGWWMKSVAGNGRRSATRGIIFSLPCGVRPPSARLDTSLGDEPMSVEGLVSSLHECSQSRAKPSCYV